MSKFIKRPEEVDFMLLKNKLENGMNEMGMDIPFHGEIKNGYNKAKAQFLHSEKCKKNRESRRQKFNKVRILYWNVMFLLSGIVLISVGRILYDVIRIIKM